MTLDLVLISKISWIVFIVIWGGIRFRPNIKSRKISISVKSRTFSERFSMIASSFGLGYIPAIWVILGWPSQFDYKPNVVMIIAGILILLFSLYLFRVTHKALGKMWSHSLDLREDHKLITSGIYNKVRHPMYSAFWAWAVGAAFLIPNWLAGFSAIIGFGTLYFLRVKQEEQMMINEFGEEYKNYMRQTKKIIPNIY